MQSELEKAKHDQQNIPIPQLSNDERVELDDYARALATIETLISQIQLLPYRYMHMMIQHALENRS